MQTTQTLDDVKLQSLAHWHIISIQVHVYIFFVVFFLLLSLKKVFFFIFVGCGDVSALFLIDWTKNVEEEEKAQMIDLVKTITAGQQDGTEASYHLVADVNTKVHNLDDVLDVSSSSASIVSASAVEAAVGRGFPFNLYPTKAEVLYILVTDRTTIELSAVVLKKKTFVIMFGRSVTTNARDVATVGNHLFLIKHDDDVDKVVEKIKQQTCTGMIFIKNIEAGNVNNPQFCIYSLTFTFTLFTLFIFRFH